MKYKRIFTREKLLNKATSLGLEIKQNPLGKWVIKDSQDDRWLIQEQDSDKWVIISHQTSGMIFTTEFGLKLLNNLIKKA